jgi:hypothetical protein
MVMREGGGKWAPAAKVKGLFPEPPSAAPRPAAALTACCPGCGRAIPLNGPHELTLTLQCARCNTRFVPAEHTAPWPSSARAWANTSPKPARSWAGLTLAVLALALGVAAMPAAIVYHPLLGAGLASFGVLLGALGLLIAITRRRAGCGLSLTGTAVCGSILFAAILLLGKGAVSDVRRAQTDTAKQDHEGSAGVATKRPNDSEGEQGSGKAEEGKPETNKASRPDADKGKPSARPGTIRLSGIHKSPSNGEPVFAAQVLSDIDLEKDNRVEADANWKGKVVEVEMELSDLRIVGGKDDAALVLEQA